MHGPDAGMGSTQSGTEVYDAAIKSRHSRGRSKKHEQSNLMGANNQQLILA